MEKVLQVTKAVKKWMTIVVLLITLLVVFASVVELGVVLFLELFDAPEDVLLLEISELFHIFGFVFMVLIGFELLESIEMYFKDNIVHAEVVLLIGVIAVTRKVVLLEIDKYDPLAIFGLGFIIIALGGCYYLLKLGSRSDTA